MQTSDLASAGAYRALGIPTRPLLQLSMLMLLLLGGFPCQGNAWFNKEKDKGAETASTQATAKEAAPSENRVCLNMVVNNERNILMPLLKSVSKQINSWFVCASDSTDGTVDLVTSFFEGAGIKGHLVHHPWKDAASNRNMCLQAGEEWSKEQAKKEKAGREHAVDYFLFVKPNQRMIILDPKLNLKTMKLTEDAYSLVQRHDSYTWGQTSMIRSGQPWIWEGKVNEYLRREGGEQESSEDESRYELPPSLPGVMVTHHRMRDVESSKRDIGLLEAHLVANPQDMRSQFSLANTYKDTQDFEKAVIHFVKRIKMGGWVEEVFFSAYSIALILQQFYLANATLSPRMRSEIESWTTMVEWEPRRHHVMRAYQAASMVLPYRQEPFYQMSKVARTELKDYDACFNYAAMAHAQGKPPATALFITQAVYDYFVLGEMCTCGYFTVAYFEAGKAACSELQGKLKEALGEAANIDSNGRGSEPIAYDTHGVSLLASTTYNINFYSEKANEKNFQAGFQSAMKMHGKYLASKLQKDMDMKDVPTLEQVFIAFDQVRELAPQRQEPLYMIGHLYRTELGEYESCAWYAQHALEQPIKLPEDSPYSFTLLSELCSCGLHTTNHYKTGHKACEDLMVKVQTSLSGGHAVGSVEESLELLMRTATTLQHYAPKKKDAGGKSGNKKSKKTKSEL